MSQVYQFVTDRILAALAKGVIPWRKPWRNDGSDSLPLRLKSRKPYRGSNVWLLEAAAMAAGYRHPAWASAKQIKSLGGEIKSLAGVTSAMVTFYARYNKCGSCGKTVTIPWKGKNAGVCPATCKHCKAATADNLVITWTLRYYNVYNVEQTKPMEGDKGDKYKKYLETYFPGTEVESDNIRYNPTPKKVKPFAAIEAAQAIVDGWEGKPSIDHGGNRACYSPALDAIRMPCKEQFEVPAEYYSTLFHELTHSTGHESRLARPGVVNIEGFGSHSYSEEELVAEFGAAYLQAEAGIESATLDNSAAYIDNWSKRLSEDDAVKWIVKASSAAQKAADLVMGRTWADGSEESNEAEAEKAA